MHVVKHCLCLPDLSACHTKPDQVSSTVIPVDGCQADTTQCHGPCFQMDTEWAAGSVMTALDWSIRLDSSNRKHTVSSRHPESHGGRNWTERTKKSLGSEKVMCLSDWMMDGWTRGTGVNMLTATWLGVTPKQEKMSCPTEASILSSVSSALCKWLWSINWRERWASTQINVSVTLVKLLTISTLKILVNKQRVKDMSRVAEGRGLKKGYGKTSQIQKVHYGLKRWVQDCFNRSPDPGVVRSGV